jgi:hypothetical protein
MFKFLSKAFLAASALLALAGAAQAQSEDQALAALDRLSEDAQHQLLCAATYQAQSEELLKTLRAQLNPVAPSQLSDLRPTPRFVDPQMGERFKTAGTQQEFLRLTFLAQQKQLFPAEVYTGALSEVRLAFSASGPQVLPELQATLEACQVYYDGLVRRESLNDSGKTEQRLSSATKFGLKRYEAVLAEKSK